MFNFAWITLYFLIDRNKSAHNGRAGADFRSCMVYLNIFICNAAILIPPIKLQTVHCLCEAQLDFLRYTNVEEKTLSDENIVV